MRISQELKFASYGSLISVWMQMPATIEELEAAIQDNLAQASSILLLNQNVLAEYEMRQRKVIPTIHLIDCHVV